MLDWVLYAQDRQLNRNGMLCLDTGLTLKNIEQILSNTKQYLNNTDQLCTTPNNTQQHWSKPNNYDKNKTEHII